MCDHLLSGVDLVGELRPQLRLATTSGLPIKGKVAIKYPKPVCINGAARFTQAPSRPMSTRIAPTS